MSKPPSIPRHVAIIMDGNGRWAKARHLPRTLGHKRGVEATRKTVQACAQRGVQVLSVFAFSSENWQRPEEEVSALMDLFVTALKREAGSLKENGIRLRFIGAIDMFSEKLRERIRQTEALTAECTQMQLVVAANYGGRWDIAQAAAKVASEHAQGLITQEQITPQYLSTKLATADLPEPDLFIRTGGEQRISNFLLWQLAYTELFFCDVLWPDFDEAVLDNAFAVFASRQRRFGRTGDQLNEARHA